MLCRSTPPAAGTVALSRGHQPRFFATSPYRNRDARPAKTFLCAARTQSADVDGQTMNSRGDQLGNVNYQGSHRLPGARVNFTQWSHRMTSRAAWTDELETNEVIAKRAKAGPQIYAGCPTVPDVADVGGLLRLGGNWENCLDL
jgi:hypothetical protein